MRYDKETQTRASRGFEMVEYKLKCSDPRLFSVGNVGFNFVLLHCDVPEYRITAAEQHSADLSLPKQNAKATRHSRGCKVRGKKQWSRRFLRFCFCFGNGSPCLKGYGHR